MLMLLDQPVVLFALAAVLLLVALLLLRSKPGIVSGSGLIGMAALFASGVLGTVGALTVILGDPTPVNVTDINQLGEDLSSPRAITTTQATTTLCFVADERRNGSADSNTYLFSVTSPQLHLQHPHFVKLSGPMPANVTPTIMAVWEGGASMQPVFNSGDAVYTLRDGAPAQCQGDALSGLVDIRASAVGCYLLTHSGSDLRLWSVTFDATQSHDRYVAVGQPLTGVAGVAGFAVNNDPDWPAAVVVKDSGGASALWVLNSGAWKKVDGVTEPRLLRSGDQRFYVAADYEKELRVVPVVDGNAVEITTVPSPLGSVQDLTVRVESGRDRVTVAARLRDGGDNLFRMVGGSNVITPWLDKDNGDEPPPGGIRSGTLVDTGAYVLAVTGDSKCWRIGKCTFSGSCVPHVWGAPQGAPSKAMIGRLVTVHDLAVFVLAHEAGGQPQDELWRWK